MRLESSNATLHREGVKVTAEDVADMIAVSSPLLWPKIIEAHAKACVREAIKKQAIETAATRISMAILESER